MSIGKKGRAQFTFTSSDLGAFTITAAQGSGVSASKGVTRQLFSPYRTRCQ